MERCGGRVVGSWKISASSLSRAVMDGAVSVRNAGVSIGKDESGAAWKEQRIKSRRRRWQSWGYVMGVG